MDTYETIISIVREDMPDIGSFVVDKQLKDLGIDRNHISGEDILRLIEAMVRVFSAFGEKKARGLRRRLIKETGAINVISSEPSAHKRVHMLTDMGKAAFYSGDYGEALNALQEALKTAERMNFKRLVVTVAIEMAQVEMRIKAFEQARKHLSMAERIAKEVYDREALLKVEYGLGAVDWWSGNYGEALEHFEKAIREGKKIGNHYVTGMACMGMANVHSELGDPQKDIEYSEMALAHLERAGDDKELAKLYTNLGVPYEEIKNYEMAEKMYEKGLELSTKTNYRGMEAWALSNLSALYTNTDRFEEAEDAANQSIKIFKEMEDELGLSIAEGMLAALYARKGDFRKATEEYEKVIELKRRVDSDYGLARSLEEYGEMLLRHGEKSKGQKIMTGAIKLYRKIDNAEKIRECREKME